MHTQIIDFKDLSRLLYLDLKEHRINSVISYRLKSPCSLLQKLIRKKLDLEEISDLIAYRIIVDSKSTCYKTLNILTKYFNLHEDRFKDLIANPKRNGYMSLHACIYLSDLDRVVEIQIRSQKMHREAEVGTANHFFYKLEQISSVQKFVEAISNDQDLSKVDALHKNFDSSITAFLNYESELKSLWQKYQDFKFL